MHRFFQSIFLAVGLLGFAAVSNAATVSVDFQYTVSIRPFHDRDELDNAVVSGSFSFNEVADTGIPILDHDLLSSRVLINGLEVPIVRVNSNALQTRIRVFEDDVAPYDLISISMVTDYMYQGVTLEAFGITFKTDVGDLGVSSTGLSRDMFSGFTRPFGRVIFDDPSTPYRDQYDIASRNLDLFEVEVQVQAVPLPASLSFLLLGLSAFASISAFKRKPRTSG